ncbi:MAG: MaoC/PaaZ C-terminal domain-containing protein [Alphaproteobacteria bacterium]|nr:acyl dehydratase [Rhodospirillaceae bacterium]MDP6020447.1 MaoC/PaaZ C-terminal domain-containing protein [Alphaproteobacteria bacterium]MDP6256029.1 MaoC/PaaZ C-terminal domain-containing protein [Alphaproteobacteria bacterium]MDP7052731.1 MaoC/PaaZ C-terminal domain-containing protein [Alphaproteobacteria bacterium]MDP7229849.1 MaoC/PaaZ C-terminal domain-containing protein [Alphaproteobacteria bacterium]
MTSQAKPRGMYFEDFEIGMELVTPRRTITLTDIVNFASLSGDFNAPHCDHEFCKTQPYGEPIAHGPLVWAVAGGLSYASGINDGTIVAMLGVDAWRIHLPVKHGDTIHVVQRVESKRETSKPDKGIVEFDREIRNQRDEVVQSAKGTNMYLRRT